MGIPAAAEILLHTVANGCTTPGVLQQINSVPTERSGECSRETTAFAPADHGVRPGMTNKKSPRLSRRRLGV
jgi:hypothetical protein